MRARNHEFRLITRSGAIKNIFLTTERAGRKRASSYLASSTILTVASISLKLKGLPMK